MNTLSTVTSGLSAALRLARGRADGVVLVADDAATAANSFWSILFCLPSVICQLLMTWVGTGVPKGAAYLIGRELLVFVLGWLVFVELSHRLAKPLGQARNWGRFVTIWNWCNVIEGIMVVVGNVPGVIGAPAWIDESCQLIMIGWALWLEWYATRLSFGISGGTAAALVLLDQIIGIILGSLAITLHP